MENEDFALLLAKARSEGKQLTDAELEALRAEADGAKPKAPKKKKKNKPTDEN